MKTIRDMLIGAFICAAVGASFASVGTPPGTGQGLIDGNWAQGVANGQNFSYQSGITAHAGGTAAAAFLLSPGIYFDEVDTVTTTGDSVALPECVAGAAIQLRNAGTNTLDVYANPTSNQAVSPAAVDTINGTAGSTAYTVPTNTNAFFFCAKTGAWSAIKGS